MIVTIDADGQMDPALMDRLIDPVVDGSAEYAKGTRLLDGNYWREMPLFRAFGNTTLTILTRIASGYWEMTDSQNGYTAISRSALQQIAIGDLFEYYGYCNAVLARLNANDIPIADVEVTTIYGDEESDIEYTDYIRNVSPMLLRKFLWRIREKYDLRDAEPPAILYAVGALSLIGGTIGTVTNVALGAVRSEDTSLRFSLVTLLVGVLSTALALLHERSASTELMDVIPFERREQTSERASVPSQSPSEEPLD